VFLYAWSGTNHVFLLMGLIMANFFSAFYAGYGLAISELYETLLRGTALGFIFNTGRLLGSGTAPILVGLLAGSMGLARAMIIGVPALILMSILYSLVPETKGKSLEGAV
jgi:nitrate/nitrite transporter NarK